jgi:hypothetical protein
MQVLPIEPHAFGAEPKLDRQGGEPRHRQGRSIDQVAPPYRADIGVNCVLNAKPEQAREPGFAGNDRIASLLGSSAAIRSGGGHRGVFKCGRRPLSLARPRGIALDDARPRCGPVAAERGDEPRRYWHWCSTGISI